MDLREGFIEVNGFASDVDSGNISLVLNSDSFGFICVTRNPNTVKMSEKNSKTEMDEVIQKILELNLPCGIGEVEILCDECPWNIAPKTDCGLALIQERARMLKLEGDTGDDYPEQGKCSECPQPSTHPSGLCRDCYQAKLEMI